MTQMWRRASLRPYFSAHEPVNLPCLASSPRFAAQGEVADSVGLCVRHFSRRRCPSFRHVRKHARSLQLLDVRQPSQILWRAHPAGATCVASEARRAARHRMKRFALVRSCMAAPAPFGSAWSFVAPGALLPASPGDWHCGPADPGRRCLRCGRRPSDSCWRLK